MRIEYKQSLTIPIAAFMSKTPKHKVILNFHGIGSPGRAYEPDEERYWISVGHFEDILDFVARDDVRSRIAITFDDGNASDADIAAPRLADAGLSASFFVLSGKLDTAGYLSIGALRDLSTNGFEIGSHGKDHRDWTFLVEQELEEEVSVAGKVLQDLLARPVDKVGIPFGKYNKRVLQKIKAENYARAFTSDGGSARDSRWLQPRTSVRSDMDVGEIEELVLQGTGFATELTRDIKMFLKSNM